MPRQCDGRLQMKTRKRFADEALTIFQKSKGEAICRKLTT
jgi:hypothetical protein